MVKSVKSDNESDGLWSRAKKHFASRLGTEFSKPSATSKSRRHLGEGRVNCEMDDTVNHDQDSEFLVDDFNAVDCKFTRRAVE